MYSAQTNPPSLTLAGESSGGPPTTHVWLKDGVEINESTPVTVSGDAVDDYQNSRYCSTLTVTERLVGVYQYSVTNRATPGTSTGTFEGMYNISEWVCGKSRGILM